MIPQYEPLITEQDKKALKNYIDDCGWLTEYKVTEEFENRVKDYLGVKYCNAVNNGTVAITLALLAGHLVNGEIVIVPNLTMVATANAARLLGLYPAVIDVEEKTLCLDCNKAIDAMKKTPTIRAIIYVSFNGRFNVNGDIEKLKDYCKKNKVLLIEDAAQSFGSSNYLGKSGSFADITTFSLAPHKIITTGQGGLIVTNNEEYAYRIKCLKDFGREESGTDIHTYFGINSKFTDLQATVGISQLDQIETRIKKKRKIYSQYKVLNELKEVSMIPTDLNTTVPWMVDIYVKRPGLLKGYLEDKGILTRTMYPTLQEQPCFQVEEVDLSTAKKFSSTGLWLPSSLNLTQQQIKFICDTIKEFYKNV